MYMYMYTCVCVYYIINVYIHICICSAILLACQHAHGPTPLGSVMGSCQCPMYNHQCPLLCAEKDGHVYVYLYVYIYLVICESAAMFTQSLFIVPQLYPRTTCFNGAIKALVISTDIEALVSSERGCSAPSELSVA